jgi:hypothetical protein
MGHPKNPPQRHRERTEAEPGGEEKDYHRLHREEDYRDERTDPGLFTNLRSVA